VASIISPWKDCGLPLPRGNISSTHLPYGSAARLGAVSSHVQVSGFPSSAKINHSYADDFNTAESWPDLDEISWKLTGHLTEISEWSKRKKLSISVAKSFVTLFSPNTRKANYHPQVFFEGDLLPLNKRPKSLGLTFSNGYVWSPQASEAGVKMSSRVQLLKAIRGLDFGDKETLRLTYNAFVKPAYSYIVPVWYPHAKPTSIKRLQSTQNNAMRIITGAHKLSSQDHLLAECEFIPVSEHLKLICCKFLASASREFHPSHYTIKLPTGLGLGRKDIVNTLQSRFGEVVEPYLTDGVLQQVSYKHVLESFHTSIVTENRHSLPSGDSPPGFQPN
jgi:hypothetical protein